MQIKRRLFLGAALLATSILPACSVPEAEAGTKTSPKVGQSIQPLVLEAPAKCNTAPARNTPRKRASVAQIFRSYNPNDLTNIDVLPSTGSELGDSFFSAQNDGGFSTSDRWASGDFDGDGDQDLIAAWNNNGATALAFRQAVGDAFVTSQISIPLLTWSAETIWVPGNFDGTGPAELAAISHDGTSTSIDVYSFSFAGGAGSATRQRWVTQGTPWRATTKWSVGDFDYNGDANTNNDRDDLVSVANINGLTATVWISSGSAFSGSAWSNQGGWSDWSSYVAGDFTGDGKADLAGIWDSGPGTTSVAVYTSTGSSFANPSQWLTTSFPHYVTDHWVVGHFTNDNKIDLLSVYRDLDEEHHEGFSVYASNASGTAFQYAFGSVNRVWSIETSICSGVFNAQQ